MLNKSITFFVFTLLVFSASVASAEDLQEVFCAEVVPTCNQAGQPMAPFNEGSCAEYYAQQCASQLANQTTEQLVSCEQNYDSLKEKLKRARRKNRRLRRRVSER